MTASDTQSKLISPRVFASFAVIKNSINNGLEILDVYRFNLNSANTTSGNLVSPSNGIPGRIRIGDIDANGYPDIIFTSYVGGS